MQTILQTAINAKVVNYCTMSEVLLNKIVRSSSKRWFILSRLFFSITGFRT